MAVIGMNLRINGFHYSLEIFPTLQSNAGLSKTSAVTSAQEKSDLENVRQNPEPQHAPILTWMLGIACVVLALAVVGLAIGLGIRLRW